MNTGLTGRAAPAWARPVVVDGCCGFCALFVGDVWRRLLCVGGVGCVGRALACPSVSVRVRPCRPPPSANGLFYYWFVCELRGSQLRIIVSCE